MLPYMAYIRILWVLCYHTYNCHTTIATSRHLAISPWISGSSSIAPSSKHNQQRMDGREHLPRNGRFRSRNIKDEYELVLLNSSWNHNSIGLVFTSVKPGFWLLIGSGQLNSNNMVQKLVPLCQRVWVYESCLIIPLVSPFTVPWLHVGTDPRNTVSPMVVNTKKNMEVYQPPRSNQPGNLSHSQTRSANDHFHRLPLLRINVTPLQIEEFSSDPPSTILHSSQGISSPQRNDHFHHIHSLS